MKKSLAKQQLLSRKVLESLSYFHKDTSRRCVTKSDCRYSGTTLNLNTKGCAVGMLLPHKQRVLLDNKVDIISSSIDTIIGFVKNNPEKAQELGIKLPKYMMDNKELFQKLQSLHDNNFNWNDKGLNLQGVNKLERICEEFSLDTNILQDLLPLEE